jgi:predicted dehydrogenase
LIRIGVLGHGYWGPNYSRNIAASPWCELAAICDISPARLTEARLMHPGVPLLDWDAMLADSRIDAVVIATPVRSHFRLALAALQAGKHVLIEKPMTRSSAEAMILIEESERRHLVLMVDHIFVFSPAVQAIGKLIQEETLGRLWYWESERLNLGLARDDVNVVWDLASHDLSILDHVMADSPTTIIATGLKPHGAGLEHLSHITLGYEGGFMAHIYVSWLSPLKVRRTVIGGSRRMLVYDDLEPVAKVTLHDYGMVANSGTTQCHRGQTSVVKTAGCEPLLLAIEHFAACVANAWRPLAGGEAGLRVVRLLEAIDAALERGGQGVALDLEGAVA